MDLSRMKEQFSIAYFHAVATVCKLKLFHCVVDDESVDITVGRTGGDGTLKSPRLDVQLKCTSQDILQDDGLHLPLKRKNYDDLRQSDLHLPKILVILKVPEDSAKWCVNIDEKALYLHHNAWWMSLLGADEKAGVDKPTVVVPRTQIFHPASLTAIMDRVGRKEPV